MGIGRQFSRVFPALNIKYLSDVLGKIYQISFIIITMLKMLSSYFNKILSLHQVFSYNGARIQKTKLSDNRCLRSEFWTI